MECIYNNNEFCTNDLCPMRGDYCPVPYIEGVCQYEEREEAAYSITPKGCLLSALQDHDINLSRDIFESVWYCFTELMDDAGYIYKD